MGRFSFVGRRLAQMVPVVLGVTIITFLLIHLIPGDPVVAILGSHYTTEGAAALRKSLGLDQSLWVQYFIFMGNLLHGNLGNSIYYAQPVLGLIFERLGATLWLVVYASVLALLIAVPLATYAALHRDSIFDQIIRGTFMLYLCTFCLDTISWGWPVGQTARYRSRQAIYLTIIEKCKDSALW